jgi:sulfatase modifying factor 1
VKRAHLASLLLAGAVLGIGCAYALHRALGPNGGPTAPGLPDTPSSSEPAEAGAPDASPEDAADSGIAASDSGVDAADSGIAEADDPEPKTLAEQRERLFSRMLAEGVTPEELAKVRAIFERSPYLGQGNPDVAVHPMTRAECRKIRAESRFTPGDPAACGGKKHMVPAFDPSAGQTRETSKLCVDQYEFPDIPCEYPVVHVQANEAAALCRAVGKRLCDAHEWEGACAGAVRSPEVEYLFGKDRRYSSGMHNLKREIVWAYGSKKDYSLCATNSTKSKSCPGGGWKQCGSNTYPTGAFPACKSPFGVYDQHGNAAEHMNLPTRPEEMMSAGEKGGLTEMKGSWFIFARGEPHLDDCRWREPSWHESKVNDPGSHSNYHLGFRCCKDR